MKVLVVEDDAALKRYLVEVFDQAGHVVHSAVNASGARALLDRHRFDVLVVDLFLGTDSGLTIAAFAGFMHPDCRIVMITGSSLFTHGELFDIAPSVSTVLRKPVHVDELLAVSEHGQA